MSKIGRKPINLGAVKIELHDNVIHYVGQKNSGQHVLPEGLRAVVDDKALTLTCSDLSRENKMLWGLHRALLANAITGADKGFQEALVINGLGFKAALSGRSLVFGLGFSHKKNFELPEGITVEIDKTGQNLVIKGNSREMVGWVGSEIRALRPPEPYKGTGIRLAKETILRKAGKTKSA